MHISISEQIDKHKQKICLFTNFRIYFNNVFSLKFNIKKWTHYKVIATFELYFLFEKLLFHRCQQFHFDITLKIKKARIRKKVHLPVKFWRKYYTYFLKSTFVTKKRTFFLNQQKQYKIITVSLSILTTWFANKSNNNFSDGLNTLVFRQNTIEQLLIGFQWRKFHFIFYKIQKNRISDGPLNEVYMYLCVCAFS